jgi:hypothetical protein
MQCWMSETDLSYTELIDWTNEFIKLSKRFNLSKEFNENGII